MNFPKVERAQVVILPDGRQQFLLTCVVCNLQFYGGEKQQRCETCGKPKIQSQKSGRSRSKRATA